MKKGSAVRVGLVFLLLGSIALSFKFRVPLALHDPNMGLALEVLAEEPSRFTRGRIRLFIFAGADPDKEIALWGFTEQPLVAAVQRGHSTQVIELSRVSNQATWNKAVAVACADDKPWLVVDALARGRGMDSSSVCSKGAVTQPDPD